MAKRTIGTDRLIDGVKIDNLPSDTNAELAGKQDTLGYNPLQSIQAGTNITIDNTDPLNPVINGTGGGGGGGDMLKATYDPAGIEQQVAFNFPIIHTTTSVNPAVPFNTYLIDASAGNVTITLPNASNDIDEYRIVLEEDTHYITVTTVGGTQLIGGLTSQIISTVGGGIYIKASTDHYDIISDTRNLERVVDVTTNIDLSTSGYENTTTYHCIPSGGTITVTLPDSSSVIAGTTVRFTLHGTGSVVIKTLSEELIEGQQEQVINVNGAIRLVNDGTHYWIDTDTRAKVQNSAVTFYSLSENSAISDGLGGYYKQSSTSTTDARYSGTSTIVTTGTIGTDTYLFGGISDEGVIQGILPEGPSTTTVNIARNTGSASFRFYIKFYKYSGGVETLIGTSSMSNVIDTTTIAEYTVTTNLSQTTFASTDRIIRKLFATSGGSPTAKVSVEGASPSFSTISSPATSIGHNSLAGIQEAGSGVAHGHITDGAQTIAGVKTFSSTITGSISGNAGTVTNGVYTTGDQTVGGVKTFTSSPIVPTPTTDMQVATKKYVDDNAGGGGTSFWTAIPGTSTRTSNTTFTITGDYTSVFKKGVIIKWTESSTIRNGMVSIPSTYSAPNTTITIIGDTMASIDASSCKYTFQEAIVKEFAVAGSIGATGTDVARAYYAPYPMRVIGADLQVGTAGTTNNTTVDLNKNGTTMFTTKPTLATTVASSPAPFTADSATSLALGDKVTLDIDAVQTTNATDLYVQLYMIPDRINFLT